MARVITHAYPPFGLLIAFALLSGCAARQEMPTEPVELPASFSKAGSQAGQPAAPDAWWQSFGDPKLDQLITRALDGNRSLRASYQRLRQAQAVSDRQSAALFPTLDATVGAERQESDTADTSTFSAGLSASYEVDLWGRVQSLSEAESLRAAASAADYQAATVSLSGETASTWFQLLEQRAQYDLARTQLETNRNVLTVIESRFATGQSSSADVLRQRQLVSASMERLSNIEGERDVLAHQLAVLLGRAPGLETLPAADTLPALPPLPETGIPAELVQRRPDLQRAWQLVQAADQDLAAAISNRFPRISIDASVSSQASDAGDLFDNWLTTLAGNVVAPLIDGGQRRAEVERAGAVKAELIQQYGQAVLTAIQEVENALVREQQQQRRLQSLENQIRLADTTYRQLRNQYLNGAVSYIEVLTAIQDRQDLQRTILTTRQQLLTNRVALYRALAGRIHSDNTHSDDRENPEA